MKIRWYAVRLWWVSLGLVSLFLCLSCRPPHSAKSGSAQTNLQIFQVKGVVKEVLPEKKQVKITHERIPDYMDAMTMMFEVKDVAELREIAPGDSVSFRMLVTLADGWIDQIKKLDNPRTPVSSEQPTFRRVREVEPLAVGDIVPDYQFTNAAGRIVKLSQFKGQALAITFIFTRCPFPTFCPRLSGNFAEAQKLLSESKTAPTNWHFLSITIDPEYDTPSRLKSYAKRFEADPARWDFLTGELIDITAIGEQFGLQFWRANPNEPINHNVRTVVIDAAGRVQWITVENEWKAPALVEQIIRAAQVKPGS